MGESSSDPKKYPQKPNLLLAPRVATTMLAARYMRKKYIPSLLHAVMCESVAGLLCSLPLKLL